MPEKISEQEMEELIGKYESKIKEQMQVDAGPRKLSTKPVASKEFTEFKKDLMPARFTFYEKACNFCERILKINPAKKDVEELTVSIRIAHLNITPAGATSFAILFPIAFIIAGSILGFLFLRGGLFFVGIAILVGLVLMIPLRSLPKFMANSWRMRASNQMVLCIFYVVTYMRHTSNLELAIDFAAEHIAPPLSLDLRKVLWDVETEKYGSMKESLDSYLETWRKWNLEFIEAFHLIEGSLLEGDEKRRVALLEKSLTVILEETYEKMLHYAQNLKGPITMLHMLGIILPILGLVILPLIVSFMPEIRWFHIATVYNVLLPIGVFYLGKNILSERPTGYGDSDISEANPELNKLKGKIINVAGVKVRMGPLFMSVVLGALLCILGFSPIIVHAINPSLDYGIGGDDAGISYSHCNADYCLQNYACPKEMGEQCDENQRLGPFGLGASILSIFVTLGLGLSIGIYYRSRTKNLMKVREKTKELEQEFASGLFQLSNRLGDGLPAEIAFGKVADVMQDTVSGHFFQLVSMNIRKIGMGVKEAIFNPQTGALNYYPSSLIESSMKVLIESIRKGPVIASKALASISTYVKEIHRVNERLKDLMADVISSMKSQINFLTPAISGIVVGITAMITAILGKLGPLLASAQETGAGAAGAAGGGLMDLFSDAIPTYYFQIIVGIYVVEIIYILSVLTNGIENGVDKLAEEDAIGSNLFRSTLIYSLVALTVTVLFNVIASSIISRTVSGG
ncbi:hypothetical protein GF351_06375 [Candidatus Woesearchaeota archaeon]|nr:hypothetical protein [Candidatus Woesearchaeota archaeon]